MKVHMKGPGSKTLCGAVDNYMAKLTEDPKKVTCHWCRQLAGKEPEPLARCPYCDGPMNDSFCNCRGRD